MNKTIDSRALPTKKPSIFRLLDLLKPKRTKYILGLTGRVAIATTERMVIGYLVKAVIDAITNQNMPLFRSILTNWVLFYVCYLFVAPFVIYVWRSAVVEGTANIRNAVFSHLQRLPLGYHEVHHTGNAPAIPKLKKGRGCSKVLNYGT